MSRRKEHNMDFSQVEKGMKFTLTNGHRVEVLDVERENSHPFDRVQLERKGTVYLKDLTTGGLIVTSVHRLRA